ncbi:hypothetical protein [Aquimarina megaterium]|uniref:hypothetical protein n=1 Tax=Aquimarina megaterium TaxID=1443666 RepID=UPI0009455714|nr:hypothetical protein [Aquimarina megaterium]
MKKLSQKIKFSIISLIIFLVVHNKCIAQQVDCNELIDLIKSKGYYTGKVDSYILDSSWLYKVTAYTYNYKTFVIAMIKRNEYSYSTDTYIFCGVPSSNWNNFKHGGYYDSDSYGKRFHKYIMEYKCNCY